MISVKANYEEWNALNGFFIFFFVLFPLVRLLLPLLLSLWTIEIWAAAAYRDRALRSVTLVSTRRGVAQSRPMWLGLQCIAQPNAAAAAAAAAVEREWERRFCVWEFDMIHSRGWCPHSRAVPTFFWIQINSKVNINYYYYFLVRFEYLTFLFNNKLKHSIGLWTIIHPSNRSSYQPALICIWN